MFEEVAASCCKALSHLAKLEESRETQVIQPTVEPLASTSAPVRRSAIMLRTVLDLCVARSYVWTKSDLTHQTKQQTIDSH
jgi:hypothetical protein